MSNTDLDLNKLEALARAAEQMFTGMHWYTRFQILDGIGNDEAAALIGALDPDTVLALIELARRASPQPVAVDEHENGWQCAICGGTKGHWAGCSAPTQDELDDGLGLAICVMRRPGMAPEIKNPFGDVAAYIREMYSHNPDADITLVRVWADSVGCQSAEDGREFLEMQDDGLPTPSRATATQHPSAAPNCGACPGDGSICKTTCQLAEDSPPVGAAPSAQIADARALRAIDALDGMGFTYDEEIGWLPAQIADDHAGDECRMCNDSGIVGFPPDQYHDCPDCIKLAAPVPVAVEDARWSKQPPTEQGEYWNWDGDEDHAPMIYHVLWSGTAKKCFVSIGQYGIDEAIWCDNFSGYWMKIEQPALPDDESEGGA